MNKRANLYFAALLGAMSPLSTVTALAAQSNSMIATATQQQNSCTGTVKDSYGELLSVLPSELMVRLGVRLLTLTVTLALQM